MTNLTVSLSDTHKPRTTSHHAQQTTAVKTRPHHQHQHQKSRHEPTNPHIPINISPRYLSIRTTHPPSYTLRPLNQQLPYSEAGFSSPTPGGANTFFSSNSFANSPF